MQNLQKIFVRLIIFFLFCVILHSIGAFKLEKSIFISFADDISSAVLACKTMSYETQKNLIAGIGSGAICKTIEYPLDTVKVLLQAHPNKYTGPLDCLKQTYKS